jgi:adenine deaminase
MKVIGNLIDIHSREIYPAEIYFEGGIIRNIVRVSSAGNEFILPGLIDSHIHIESSMVTPGSFAVAAVSRGTTGVVSDPHEIANVMGIGGVKFMIEDSKKVPLKFWFGAPSCVPATSFESAGAVINSDGIKELLDMPEIKYLAEMMNFPGVIYDDPEVIRKLGIARSAGKPVDGHAPGLTGENLKKYISSGISTDHECSSLAEAEEKISLGMKILIREGSAAKNLSALRQLIKTNPEMVMLCSDDLHPEMLLKRHINKIVADLISDGFDIFDVIRSCTVNPAFHYGLDAGLIQTGQPADFIIVDDYMKMNVIETWINGRKVYDRGSVTFEYSRTEPLNRFDCSELTADDIRINRTGNKMRVIQAFDGELLTRETIIESGPEKYTVADTGNDILKLVVKDRYGDLPPAVGFIKGFGLKKGAIAASVAHDSHNIISVGTSDDEIVEAVNTIIKMKGGLAASQGKSVKSLKLNIAGIMSDLPLNLVAAEYKSLSGFVKSMGSTLSEPFMTLSFMALLVIPELKLSDKGLFDGIKFCHVPLFVE